MFYFELAVFENPDVEVVDFEKADMEEVYKLEEGNLEEHSDKYWGEGYSEELMNVSLNVVEHWQHTGDLDQVLKLWCEV